MTDKKLVIIDGKEAYEYPDGSIRDEKGYFVKKPSYAHEITSKDASQLAERRWEMVREATVQGAMRGTKMPTEPKAIESIMEIRTQVAVDKDAGHAGNEATKLVARMAGWLRPQDTGPAVVQNIVALPADLIDRLTK